MVLLGAVVFVFNGRGDSFLFGYKPYIVSTGSMEPEYSTHCIVLIKQDPYEEVRLGDVVAFKSVQLGESEAMHRVIDQTPQGFITKGDNNDNADDETVTLENYIGRAIWHTNALAGYIDKLMEPNGVLLFLVMPLGGIILLTIAIKLLIPSRGKQNLTSLPPDTSWEESTSEEDFQKDSEFLQPGEIVFYDGDITDEIKN